MEDEEEKQEEKKKKVNKRTQKEPKRVAAARNKDTNDGCSSERRCGGCLQKCGSIHQCPYCSVSMHAFCGTPIGKEGFGQPVVCPTCQEARRTCSNSADMHPEGDPVSIADNLSAPMSCYTSQQDVYVPVLTVDNASYCASSDLLQQDVHVPVSMGNNASVSTTSSDMSEQDPVPTVDNASVATLSDMPPYVPEEMAESSSDEEVASNYEDEGDDPYEETPCTDADNVFAAYQDRLKSDANNEVVVEAQDEEMLRGDKQLLQSILNCDGTVQSKTL